MTLEDELRDDVAAFHREIGEEVTLVQRTVATDANGDWITDDHGNPEYDATRETILAELALRGSPTFDQRASGLDVDLTAIGWVLDSVDLYTGDESDTRAPSLLETEQGRLRVFEIVPERNGKLQVWLVDD